jgi:hypothetical protein
MVQLRQRSGFAMKVPPRLFSRQHSLSQHLDRDCALEFFVARAVHNTHAAGTERLDNQIPPQM